MIKENIALFDLDGTLCDYEKQLLSDLNALKSPKENILKKFDDSSSEFIHIRADLIRSCEKWWATLPKFQLGWDILELTKFYDFRTMICTAGPKKNSAAWSGKKIWIDKNLGDQTDITITRDKGLVYGRMLVDDFPKYIERWLQWRKNGLVIMPANHQNKNFKHPQVIRYDGSNLEQVKQAIKSLL